MRGLAGTRGKTAWRQPAQAGRRGRGGDRRGTQTVMTRRPGRGGQGCVSTRCRLGGTQTVMTRRPGHGGQGCVSTRCPRCGTQTVMIRRPGRNGEASVSTRCLQGGTQTVLTRRPRRHGEGYVSTRCPQGGTQAAMPRRTRRGGRSTMTRCPRLAPSVRLRPITRPPLHQVERGCMLSGSGFAGWGDGWLAPLWSRRGAGGRGFPLAGGRRVGRCRTPSLYRSCCPSHQCRSKSRLPGTARRWQKQIWI